MKLAIRVVYALVLFLFFAHSNVLASVFASQLKITNPDGSSFDGNFTDGSGAVFSFILNDTASSVIVRVKDAATGATVIEIDAGPLGSGMQTVDWDGKGAIAGGTYFYEVFAEQPNYSATEWTVFFDSGDIDIFTRGCDVVSDMTSPLFGLIYTPNNGGPLKRGITIYNPDGSFHDPFLVAADDDDGGTIDWGSGDPMVSGVFDDEERFYVSSIQYGEVRRINLDYSVTSVVTGLTFPKGLHITGAGADRMLYICDDNKVLRAAIGDNDVFSGTPEVVGEFSGAKPRDVALDDAGNMYVIFRQLNGLDADGAGIRKYDISGNLPVGFDDATWFLGEDVTHIAVELQFDHGADRTTNEDDILYYSTRAGGSSFDDGVWRVDDINSFFPNVVPVVTEQALYGNDIGANINARAAIAQDAAGNIILMENSNEHVFFFAPPGEGPTNSFTTTSPDSFQVLAVTAVEPAATMGIPAAYALEQNYPNPFNPGTQIRYTLAAGGRTMIRIYNAVGAEIRTLLDAEQPAGAYSIQWDGRDRNGRAVSSGVYILKLDSGGFSKTIRMTLTK